MITYEYIFEDDSTGLLMVISGEVIDYEDDEDEDPYEVILNEISYDGKPIHMWTLSRTYINHLENKMFQQWCFEGRK